MCTYTMQCPPKTKPCTQVLLINGDIILVHMAKLARFAMAQVIIMTRECTVSIRTNNFLPNCSISKQSGAVICTRSFPRAARTCAERPWTRNS